MTTEPEDFRQRLQGGINSMGFESIESLLASRPGASYEEIALEVGGTSAAEVAILHYSCSAHPSRLRHVCRDSLVRAIRKHARDGWARGRNWEWKCAYARSEWISYLAWMPEKMALRQRCQAVWDELVSENPPEGWPPEDPNDLFIERAFGRGWPS